MAFQNFGFREGAINNADLLESVIQGKESPSLSSPGSPEAKRQRRGLAVARAKVWWQQANRNWNRFDAILEALRSEDPVRQFWTLYWIRSGKTKCARLHKESFKREIEPEVRRFLNSGTQGVRDEAKYVLEDRRYLWLKDK